MNNFYIKKNKLYFTKENGFDTNKEKALSFKNESKAIKVLNNSVAASVRPLCKIVIEREIAEQSDSNFVVVYNNTNSIVSAIFPILEIRANLVDAVNEMDSILEENKENLVKRHEYLSSKLSVLDKEVNDIVHYIEFNELSEEDGFRAYKMLHDRTGERRLVKNEKYNLEFVFDVLNGKKKFSAYKAFLKNQAAPVYVPRAMPELFCKAV